MIQVPNQSVCLISTKSTKANNNLILLIQFNRCCTCIRTPSSLLIYLKFLQCVKDVSTSSTTMTKQQFVICGRLTIYSTNLWAELRIWSYTSPSIKINSLKEIYLEDRIKLIISNLLDQGSQIVSKLEDLSDSNFFLFFFVNIVMYLSILVVRFEGIVIDLLVCQQVSKISIYLRDLY